MNKILTLTITAIAAFLLISCECDCPKNTNNSSTENSSEVLNSPQRSGSSGESATAAALMESFTEMAESAQALEFADLNAPADFVVADNMISRTAGSDTKEVDVSAVMGLYNTLMQADSDQNILDMKFSMSQTPVEDGLFLFALEVNEATKEAIDLNFQMFSEKDFELVANNRFQVTAGSNYKAIRVTDFANGSYIFKLTDNIGRELVRRVKIGDNQITQ